MDTAGWDRIRWAAVPPLFFIAYEGPYEVLPILRCVEIVIAFAEG